MKEHVIGDRLQVLYNELKVKYSGVQEDYEDGTERCHTYDVELHDDRVDVITRDDGGCEIGREIHR